MLSGHLPVCLAAPRQRAVAAVLEAARPVVPVCRSPAVSRSSCWHQPLAAGIPRSRSFAAEAGGSQNPQAGGSPNPQAGGSPNSRESEKQFGGNMGPDAGELQKGGDNIQFTWRSAVFTMAVAGGCLGYYEFLKRRKEAESRAVTKHERIGTPKLGGPFELLDRKGKTVTDKDFLGKYLLIYFGFTFCPDICPQEMEKQTRAIELVEEKFGPVAVPVFISVDPARDSVAQVDDYCNEFHPRIQGLTGTDEQIKKVSRAYRVYFNQGITNSDKDYLIDHSIIHYFVGKNGKFVDFFGKNMTAQEMADKMIQTILEDKQRVDERKSRRGVESDEDDE